MTTLDIQENKVKGWDCAFVASPEELTGKVEPFHPFWYIQSLVDGTMMYFDTLQETFEWLDEYNNQ
jgi:hypothetical protein